MFTKKKNRWSSNWFSLVWYQMTWMIYWQIWISFFVSGKYISAGKIYHTHAMKTDKLEITPIAKLSSAQHQFNPALPCFNLNLTFFSEPTTHPPTCESLFWPKLQQLKEILGLILCQIGSYHELYSHSTTNWFSLAQS